jgi:HEPN pEK499 p136
MAKKNDTAIGPRNDPLGLVRRSISNLELIERSYASHKEGHIVTQLMQTLLMLIVIPKEKGLLDQFRRWRLIDLNEQKWPSLRPIKDDENDTATLYDVLWHMRNSISHGLFTFSGDGAGGSNSRDINEIVVEFQDRNAPTAPIDWELRLEGPEVRKLCKLIEEIVFD